MECKNMKGSRLVFSLDSEWSFHLGDFSVNMGNGHGVIYGTSKAGACAGVPQADFSAADWEKVDLPHDWSVKREFDISGSPSWGYKPKGKAWYRRQFMLPEELKDKNITLEFEGVAKDCTVYFNGSVLKRHYSAYAPFSIDITDRALFDGTPNVLAVYVDADGWEGWWYEGAGIYRHVRLVAKEKLGIKQYGIYCAPHFDFGKWYCEPEITVENTGFSIGKPTVYCEIADGDTGEIVACDSMKIEVLPGEEKGCKFFFEFQDVKLWDIDSPKLYKCRAVVVDGMGMHGDCDSVNFGFRQIDFDAQKGFLLNGRVVKIYGTCNHQDHGGIGVAIPDSVHEYRIKRLKEMGSNAYRCAHGMPHAELLDVCDREGMLVMDENRSFETSEQCLEELRTMVLRDRNHPSVIMWSIFNEEPLQGTEQGRKMAERMRFEIRRLDGSRFVTGAMNGGVTEINGAAQALDVAGINYQLFAYDEFHKRFPNIPVIGTETTSTFAVRGCYETDYSRHIIDCYDENPAEWGNTVRQTWQCINERDFASGGFMWTGFDYLGEPTPFEYPSVSSFFGMMDVCGFAKDGFWLCKAIFSDEPVCHVLPHWNFKGHEGEIIRVMSHTNCEEAELFVNSKSFGKRKIDKLKQSVWEVPYEAGELRLVGYNGGETAAQCVRETTDEAAEIKAEFANVNSLSDDGLDAAIVNFIAVDRKGREVPDFCGEMHLEITGGELVGTANGNPNCHEPFDRKIRSLFNGRAQAIIRPFKGVKYLTINAECGKIKCEPLTVKTSSKRGGLQTIDAVQEIRANVWRVSAKLSELRPDPNAEIADNDMNSFEPYQPKHGDGSKMADSVGLWALYRTQINIPERLNGRLPVIHFTQLWGKGEVWVNGVKRLDFDNEWAAPADIPCTAEMMGETVISVAVQCVNKYGGGVTSAVVIR